MPNNFFDIAIIGGGLAGLSLAIQAAKKDYKVVLFEKEIYPFHKVCGEYISNESLDFIKLLGVPLNNYNLPSINKLNISDAKGRQYSFDLPLGGFGISRYKLDNELYKIAQQKGVQIFIETKVINVEFKDHVFIIYTSSGDFNAKVAIGSFGKKSNLDIKLNRFFSVAKPDKLNNFIGVKYHIKYHQPTEIISLHNFKNGYCGISNIENDKCCLCYLTTAENLKQNQNSVKVLEQQALWQNPLLERIFSNAEFLYEAPLTISQISFDKKTQIENHILMLGDAAGMITPLCGNGMSMALHSSKIAFANVDNFLKKRISRKQMENNYELQWKQHFSRRLQTGRIVQRFFGNETSTAFFLKLMNTIPFIAKQIIQSTHGKSF